MLRLEGVSARTGSFILKPLDMEIPSGECHALLGPSGAGKSTILELIVGFRRPESGRIFLNGKDLAHISVERRGICYLPQQLALFPHLSVKENIMYGIRCRRRPNQDDFAVVASLTDALGLADLKERMPASLSGGERQRVALARALAPSPKLLILDEPFSALNETLRRELWGLLESTQKQYDVVTLLVTHDLEEAFFLGKQVHILIDGRLHQSGARQVVFNRPTTLDVARFLGIQNLFPAQVLHGDGHHVVIDCVSLGFQYTIENGSRECSHLRNGDRLTVGIRPEFVALARNRETGAQKSPLLTGTVVDVSETMRGFLISVKPKGREALIIAAVGIQEGLGLAQKEIRIILPESHLFCIRS